MTWTRRLAKRSDDMETRNELMIYAGKDDYTGRRDGRCAHPNTVRGRIAPRKLEVHGSALLWLGE